MRQAAAVVFVAVGLSLAAVSAQAPATDVVPYKLGTFEQAGRLFLGLVLDDTLVADLEQANAAFERERAGAARVAMPRDMKALIEQYDDEARGLKARLAALARAVATMAPRPAYVREVTSVRTRPPIMYPLTMLNAAVNFAEHGQEMGEILGPAGGPPASIPGLWTREPGDARHNPYMFLKPPSVVIGQGDAIELPPGRDRIDWECEISVVVGRRARRVPIDRANDYIFGYTLQNDVSDRGGRVDGRHGTDWLIGKGHDTFAPLGPYIVPKAFVPDPQKLGITFTLSGKVMQDSNTDRMTHTVYEMLSFGSHILTLHPGDVLAMGSPAGVGTARATPIYFKPGDTAVCAIEGIGTLTNPVVAASVASAPSR